jgi:vacuolar-type H+-ATPase catalytic subunit A/Vma1
MADEAVANPVLQKPAVYVRNITFNDGKRFDFNKNNIVVFTRVNNVGKSQVLKDILQSFQSKDKNLSKIVTNLEADFLGDIEYYLTKTRKDINGNYWTGTGFQHESNIKSWWNRKTLINGLHANFINFLHTEQRLTASNSPESFNALKDMPKHPIQHLYNDDCKETELSKYFHQAFGEKLILYRCAGNIIPNFVSQNIQMDREIDEDRASATYRKM